MIQKFQSHVTHSQDHPWRRGFTLIELLVVTAILGILLSLMVSAVTAGLRSARSAACMSNLRQIGTAFTIFATENNGHLPPNLHPNQSPYFNRDRRYLAHPSKLGSYLNAPEPTSWTVNLQQMSYANALLCPARAVLGGDHRDMYRLNTRVETLTGTTGNPWGTGNAANDMLNNPAFAPSKFVSDIKNASTTWLLADLDDEFPVGSPPNNAPETAVHGNHRNAIYFDMHVGRLHIPDVTGL